MKSIHSVIFTFGAHKIKKTIHNLVAETFLTAPTTGYTSFVTHIDGDKSNNSLSNLQYRVKHFTLSRSEDGDSFISKKTNSNKTLYVEDTEKVKKLENLITIGRTFVKNDVNINKTDIWKKIKHSSYEISDKGITRHIKTKKINRVYATTGYAIILVDTLGVSTKKSLHKLMAGLFFKPPTDKMYKFISHIDGNKFNNNVDNLEYRLKKSSFSKSDLLTHNNDKLLGDYRTSINKLKQLNKTLKVKNTAITYKSISKKYNLDNPSAWCKIENSDYEISIEGLVRHIKTGELSPNYYANGGIFVSIVISNERIRKAVHKLMGETFLNKPDHTMLKIPKHKDNNKFNNSIDNLYYKVKHKYICNRLTVTNVATKVKVVYRSARDICKDLKMDYQALLPRILLSELYPIFGIYHVTIGITRKIVPSINSRKVYVLDKLNNEINEYNSITNTAYYIGIRCLHKLILSDPMEIISFVITYRLETINKLLKKSVYTGGHMKINDFTFSKKEELDLYKLRTIYYTKPPKLII